MAKRKGINWQSMREIAELSGQLSATLARLHGIARSAVDSMESGEANGDMAAHYYKTVNGYTPGMTGALVNLIRMLTNLSLPISGK